MDEELIKDEYSELYIETPMYRQLWYHYTDIGGLIGIIKSCSLYASESSFLNDSEEIIYIDKLLDEIINKDKEKLLEKYDRNFVERLINRRVIIREESLPNEFIISFSLNPDSLMLWSYYSDMQGYNIGFDIKQLLEFSNNYINDNASVLVGKVVYDYNKQKNILYKEIDECYEKYRAEKNDSKIFAIMMKLYLKIKRYAYFFKNPLLHSEEEGRMIFIPGHTFDYKKIEHRASNGIILPYVRYDINPTKKLPINTITVGPTNKFGITQRGIKSLLLLSDYELNRINIKKSSIPYRY